MRIKIGMTVLDLDSKPIFTFDRNHDPLIIVDGKEIPIARDLDTNVALCGWIEQGCPVPEKKPRIVRPLSGYELAFDVVKWYNHL